MIAAGTGTVRFLKGSGPSYVYQASVDGHRAKTIWAAQTALHGFLEKKKKSSASRDEGRAWGESGKAGILSKHNAGNFQPTN